MLCIQLVINWVTVMVRNEAVVFFQLCSSQMVCTVCVNTNECLSAFLSGTEAFRNRCGELHGFYSTQLQAPPHVWSESLGQLGAVQDSTHWRWASPTCCCLTLNVFYFMLLCAAANVLSPTVVLLSNSLGTKCEETWMFWVFPLSFVSKTADFKN